MIIAGPNGVEKPTLLETIGNQIRGDIRTGCKLEKNSICYKDKHHEI
jgi:predicted ATPase